MFGLFRRQRPPEAKAPTMTIQRPQHRQSDHQSRPVLEYLADYIDAQLQAGYPRHKLIQEIRTQMYDAYMASDVHRNPRDYLYHPELRFADMEVINNWNAVSAMLTKYESAMSKRCLSGRELERLGRIDEAINLYMQNVYDQHNGTMSYDRLRIIFTKQKRFDMAILACERYLALPWRQDGPACEFERHLVKLRLKEQRQLVNN